MNRDTKMETSVLAEFAKMIEKGNTVLVLVFRFKMSKEIEK